MARDPDLKFTVRGLPAPQGSKSAFINPHTGRAGMKESSARVRPWRQDVVAGARDAIEQLEAETGERWTPLSGAVHVVIEFYMPRPAGHPKTRRTLPTTSPDLDKLMRSTGDGMKTAAVYRDDSQITDLTIRERYAVYDEAVGHPWELPSVGAVVSVFSLDPDETWADVPLEYLVAERLPTPVLPMAVAERRELSEEALLAVAAAITDGTDLIVPATMTDADAVKILRRARAIGEKNLAAIAKGKPAPAWAVVHIEDGEQRLASIPRKPTTPLQDLASELAQMPAEAQVALLLTGPRVEVSAVASPAVLSVVEDVLVP